MAARCLRNTGRFTSVRGRLRETRKKRAEAKHRGLTPKLDPRTLQVPFKTETCVVGGGGRNRTAVRRHSIPGTTCLARRWISPPGSTTCEAHRGTSLSVQPRKTGNRRGWFP